MGVFADGNTYGLAQNLVLAFPVMAGGSQVLIASVCMHCVDRRVGEPRRALS